MKHHRSREELSEGEEFLKVASEESKFNSNLSAQIAQECKVLLAQATDQETLQPKLLASSTSYEIEFYESSFIRAEKFHGLYSQTTQGKLLELCQQCAKKGLTKMARDYYQKYFGAQETMASKTKVFGPLVSHLLDVGFDYLD